MTQLRTSRRGWMMKAVLVAAFIFALQFVWATELPRESDLLTTPSETQPLTLPAAQRAVAESRALGLVPAPNRRVLAPSLSSAGSVTRAVRTASYDSAAPTTDKAPQPLAPSDTMEPQSLVFPFSGNASHTINLVGNRSVENMRTIVRNTGTVPIVNPWVVFNSERNFQTTQSILTEAQGAQTSAENKAYALWAFLCRYNYNWFPAESSKELHNPVRLLNIYGSGFCDDISAVSELLYKRAGLTARSWELNGHVVNEVQISGGYRVFDADLEFFYPQTNNITLASVATLQLNGSLVSRVSGTTIAAIYTSRTGDYNFQNMWEDNHSMNFVLRPGEALERCHYNWGKYHDNLYHMEPPVYGNGRQVYTPPLEAWNLSTAFSRLNQLEEAPAETVTPKQPGLQIAVGKSDGEAELSITTPYTYVDGDLSLDVNLPNVGDVLAVRVWRSNGSQTVLASKVGPYVGRVSVPLGDVTARTSSGACRDLFARISLARGATSAGLPVGFANVEFVGEIQCAPSALPTLLPDTLNTISFTCTTGTDTLGELVVDWMQEADGTPRYAPSTVISPTNAGIIYDSAPLLRWNSVDTTDTLYREVVVCHDSACLKPVAPPLIFRGEIANQWKVPAGWLVPGRVYYWRVREGSNTAPWSPAWRFTLATPPAQVEDWGRY